MIHSSRDMRGFTLIETLVAIAILTIMMGAPFYAVEQSIRAADSSRDELTASFLAQEGIEYIREIRDNNYLAVRANPSDKRTWLYKLDGTDTTGIPNSTFTNCFGTSYVCTVDPTTSSIAQLLANATVPVLYVDPGTNLYTMQTSGSSGNNTPTLFRRSVQLSTVTGSVTEVKVVATVTWTTRNTPYVTTITEYLDNWLQ